MKQHNYIPVNHKVYDTTRKAYRLTTSFSHKESEALVAQIKRACAGVMGTMKTPEESPDIYTQSAVFSLEVPCSKQTLDSVSELEELILQVRDQERPEHPGVTELIEELTEVKRMLQSVV